MIAGTLQYMPPEVFKSRGSPESYKEPLDIWACGITMYNLLSGKFPFKEPNIEREIMEEDVVFMSKRWDGVSTAAKDLIRKMLTKQPDRRIALDECLKHPFFQVI